MSDIAAPVAEQNYIPTSQDDLPIKDDINPVSFVRQTFGEAKPKYYVMMVGGGVPTRAHRSRFWAEQEAKRLAGQHPDKVFHVLKVKSTFESKLQDIAAAEARTNLKIGQMVRIGKFHFRNPNELGEIVGFTPVGAIDVRLQNGKTFPFAPTSFRPLHTPDVGTIDEAHSVLEGVEE
jgi:hypothetical protein